MVFVASAFSQYLGAGLAVSLFSLMPSTTVAWWRLVVGAVVLLALRRPWRRSWTRRALALAAAFGTATATMNVIFYAAISLLPLGTVVSLEFLGPVAVAAITGRGWRPRCAAVLALLGVGLLSTAVPYGLDQVVLKRLGTDTFALLSSLMPATSMLVGVAVLGQLPGVWEVTGLVLVSVAVALASVDGRPPRPRRR